MLGKGRGFGLTDVPPDINSPKRSSLMRGFAGTSSVGGMVSWTLGNWTFSHVDKIYDETFSNEGNYESESSEEMEWVEECNSTPRIENMDESRMQEHCDGSKVGESCRISCKKNYQPTKDTVGCLRVGNSATWDLNGAMCVYNVETVCRDQHNRKTEWFILYKLPKDQKNNTGDGMDGDGVNISGGGERYIYFSDTTSFESNISSFPAFFELDRNVSHENPVSKTLERFNGIDIGNMEFAMYSDGHPLPEGVQNNISATYAYGKAKGMVMHDGRGHGFLLVHSQSLLLENSRFRAADNSAEEGQMFLCISFNSNRDLGKVTDYLRELRPNVYLASKNLNIKSPVIGDLPYPDRNKRCSPYKSRRLWTFNNKHKFDLISKTKAVDIYSQVIAVRYRKDFDVVSWKYCKRSPFYADISARDARSLEVCDSGVRFNSQATKEHANWAVSKLTDTPAHNLFPDDDNVFCISDFSIMGSECRRGGGAVCIRKRNVSQAFRKLLPLKVDLKINK